MANYDSGDYSAGKAVMEVKQMHTNQHVNNAIKMTLAGLSTIYCQTVIATECPQNLHNLPVPAHVNTCHSFLDDFPAALSFYSPEAPINLKQFYLDAGVDIAISRQNQGRFILIGQQDQYRIIISQDGAGSQVDLLVNRPNK